MALELVGLRALADAFTICHQYFGSVIGPTQPNRAYTVSASNDLDGKHGGPIVETYSLLTRAKKIGMEWIPFDGYCPQKGIHSIPVENPRLGRRLSLDGSRPLETVEASRANPIVLRDGPCRQ